MHVAMLETSEGRLPALKDAEAFYDLRAIDPAYRTEIPYFESLLAADRFSESYFQELLDTARNNGSLEQAAVDGPYRHLIPVRPGKIVALGRNYAAHAKELGNEIPTEPILFYKSPTACIGHEDSIVIKPWYGRVDHEGELAILIGKRATSIAEEDAFDHVAGYTLLNDVTERDLQSIDKKKGHPWFRSKNLDTFCPIGPVITLPSALPWPPEVDLTLTVNGELRQQGNTRQFIFSIPQMLAYISRFMTLEPGDLVSTGTPEGVSALHEGDVVELSVSEIGTLTNSVELQD